MRSRSNTKKVNVKFEEMELGTTYSELRHLVVATVTESVTSAAGRDSISLAKVRLGAACGEGSLASDLFSIQEDEGDVISTSASSSSIDVRLEKGAPQWQTRNWFDNTLVVEGFCHDMVRQSANSLDDMMDAHENIKLGVIQLNIHALSRLFAKDSIRLDLYVCTAT